jgi:hypothetical protein
LALSASAVVAIPLWWMTTRPQIEAGSVPSVRSRPVAAMRVDPAAPEVPAIQVASARLTDRRPEEEGPRPSRIRIASIGVDAAVVSVGIDQPASMMQVPADISKVGWYRFGPSPGRPGSALLVGHVDSSDLGAGVFFRLRAVPIGAVVSVEFTDDSTARFRVTGRRSYPKAGLPERLFARSGTPVLTLITCGGAFDRTTGHYQDNVVVYAVPAGR